MARLYDISVEYEQTLAEISECAAENDGVVPDELMTKLQTLDENFDVKAENYVRAIKNYEADHKLYKAEADRLKAKAEGAKSSCDFLKGQLLAAMTAVGKDRTSTAIASVSIRTDKAVAVTDEALIPAEYIKTKTETSVDKTAIKDRLKAGEVIPGAELKENKSVQIR